MNILFVSDTYYPHLNGVYYFVCRLAPLLQERGHRVAVIAPSETIYLSHKRIDNIDVYGVPSLPVGYYPNVRISIPFFLKARIKHLLNTFEPDVIHLQDHFSISKAVVKVNRKLGIPIIGTNHFMPENLTTLIQSKRWKKELTKFLWSQFSSVYNQLSLVTTPSETAADLIRPKLKVSVVAISSGIDFQKFNPSGNTDDIKKKYAIPDRPILLFVGRVDPEKNLEEVVRAVALAVKKVDFYFVIVGKGIRKAMLENLALELNIADRIIFTGYVPEEELPYFYKLSHCFVIASIAELLSLATLQAMASGLPVIAADVCALSELVQDNVNGYLFKSGDIHAIAQGMNNVVTRQDLYHAMCEKSLEYSRRHDINKTVESFERVYKRAVDDTASVLHRNLSTQTMMTSS
ncbi:MAG: rfaG [Segetibacter sp.]|nr:rfaG [Segetibacter sp.]